VPDATELELPEPPRLGRRGRREKRPKAALGRDGIARAATLEDTMWGPKTLAHEDVISFATEGRASFGALPADRFPHLRALASDLTEASGPDDRFEFGLEVIVRGLAPMAVADAPPASTAADPARAIGDPGS
jgi:Tetracyclin repressor-like, C-terminal domain